MRQKISLSRWNIGETSQRSIGDYDQPFHAGTCRFLNNFVISETGKLWRRPGFTHHAELATDEVRLVPLYLRNDTYILVVYLTGTHPTQSLVFDWYKLVNERFVKQAGPLTIYTFKSDDFDEDRPDTVDLKRLSWVQVESVDQYITFVHPNMEDPYDAAFSMSSETFAISAYPTTAVYFDINYVSSAWTKLPSLLTVGGGTNGGGDVGWLPYTGEIPTNTDFAKNPDDRGSFKYLAAVTYAFQRLVLARGSYVFGSTAGDPLVIGSQYNTDITSAIEVDATKIIASDPFQYKMGSDLGYEDVAWLASGPLLMAGANNGAWVLASGQSNALDATNPLFYKATANGCHWVPGKVIGDAMIYFQRPGRQLNEFLFANASQNYVTTNLSEFSDHLFFDNVPVEMQIQRSPFNVAWILRDDGTLISFTYDRPRQIYGWARHSFDLTVGEDAPFSHGSVNSLCIYSDGVIDRPVVATTRPRKTDATTDVTYYALEMMDFYTPDQVTGVFVDSAVEEELHEAVEVISITEDAVNGHWINIDPTATDFVNDDILNFIGASRTEDGVQPIADEKYDYIYGEWTVFDYDSPGKRFRLKDKTGAIYKGIFEEYDEVTSTEFAYTNFGSCQAVTSNPPTASVPDYLHLSGTKCRCLMDGNPKDIYISYDATTFYKAESIPDDWDGDESVLTGNDVFWNSIIIGRPYESIFSPFNMKKQVEKAKIAEIEIEVFRSLGGKVGTATVSLDNEIENQKFVDLVYPAIFEDDRLYTGTLKPKITGGYGDDPLWLILVDNAVPFNLTNAIYHMEVN